MVEEPWKEEIRWRVQPSRLGRGFGTMYDEVADQIRIQLYK